MKQNLLLKYKNISQHTKTFFTLLHTSLLDLFLAIDTL